MPRFFFSRALCASTLVCLTLGAAPLEPTRLLVLPLSPAPAATARAEPRQHVTIREAIEQALFDDLPDERLDVVSPERSDGAQPVAAATPAAVAQVGRDAGAAYVLVGRYRVRGEALRVDARLVQTASGRTAAVFAVEGTTDDLPAVQRQLVSDVRWHVAVAESGPLPELAPELRPPVEVAGDAGIPLPRGPGAYGLDGAAPLPPGAHTGTSGGAPWRRASDDGDDFYDPDRFRPAVTPGGGNTMLAGAGNQVGSPSAGPGRPRNGNYILPRDGNTITGGDGHQIVSRYRWQIEAKYPHVMVGGQGNVMKLGTGGNTVRNGNGNTNRGGPGNTMRANRDDD